MNRAVNYGLSKMQEMLGASGLGEEVAVGALCVPGWEHARIEPLDSLLEMLVKRCDIPRVNKSKLMTDELKVSF